MKTEFEIRYSSHPEDFKQYDTKRIRKEFLISDLFQPNILKWVYSMYDRLMVGGAMPVSPMFLESIDPLKASYFLERRELGIINVGGTAKIKVNEVTYELEFKEALYIGMGNKSVSFDSIDPEFPALLYLNSAPAHKSYATKKVTLSEALVLEPGSAETSNARKINKLLVNEIVETCRLQMGMTELKSGSVWNTMPPHTHDRRMEAYFYFEVPKGQAICHFMGQPDETRHLWLTNQQAVLSPSWSIHAAAGTSNYIFIWGMTGENLDYSDMDAITADHLK